MLKNLLHSRLVHKLSLKYSYIQRFTPHAWIVTLILYGTSYGKRQCFFLKRLFISDLVSLSLGVCFCSIASTDFFALQTIRNLANVFESLTGFMQRLNDLDLANVVYQIDVVYSSLDLDMKLICIGLHVAKSTACCMQFALGFLDLSWRKKGSAVDSGRNERRIYHLFADVLVFWNDIQKNPSICKEIYTYTSCRTKVFPCY